MKKNHPRLVGYETISYNTFFYLQSTPISLTIFVPCSRHSPRLPSASPTVCPSSAPLGIDLTCPCRVSLLIAVTLSLTSLCPIIHCVPLLSTLLRLTSVSSFARKGFVGVQNFTSCLVVGQE